MARGPVQAEALFDVTSDGAFLLPYEMAEAAPAEPIEQPVDLRDPAVWQEGLERPLSQEERALIAVAPDSVNIAERAGHLTMALDEISLGNRDRGFAAAANSTDYRSKIEAWGGARTDEIANEVAYRGLTHERRARYEFFAASGMGSLALATAETPLGRDQRIARRYLDERWNDFREQYGGSGAEMRKRRAAYKLKLADQLIPRDTN